MCLDYVYIWNVAGRGCHEEMGRGAACASMASGLLLTLESVPSRSLSCRDGNVRRDLQRRIVAASGETDAYNSVSLHLGYASLTAHGRSLLAFSLYTLI